MTKKPLLLPLCTSAMIASLHAAPPVIEAVDARMKNFVEAKEVSGAVTLVADEEQILHLSAVGLADIENMTPMAADSIFWIASMTKPITATAVMMMQEEGKLSVDDPVSKYYLKEESVRQMTSVQSGDLVTGFTPGNAWGLGWCVVREPQGVSAALSGGSFGHGGRNGTQAWIDPVKNRIYLLMIQRDDMGNSDASEIRRDFQNAAKP